MALLRRWMCIRATAAGHDRSRGGGLCPGQHALHPDDVRELLGIPDSTAIVLGISFGYENADVEANRTWVGRVPLGDSVRFFGGG